MRRCILTVCVLQTFAFWFRWIAELSGAWATFVTHSARPRCTVHLAHGGVVCLVAFNRHASPDYLDAGIENPQIPLRIYMNIIEYHSLHQSREKKDPDRRF